MLEIPQKFPGEREGDKVVLFVRKHWIKYAIVFLVSLVLFAIPLIALIFFLLNTADTTAFSAELLTVGISTYVLIMMGLILHAFVDFYLDMLVITQDRVIYVRQNGFFNQQIDEVHIWDVDECGVDIKGFLKSMLCYGDLVIHTGNDAAILTVDDVPHPDKIAQRIMHLHKEHVEAEAPKVKEIEEDKVHKHKPSQEV